MFDRIVNTTLSEKVSTTGVTQENLEPPCLLILLIQTKYKTIRRNVGLAPLFYSLEEEIIHWVVNAKNVWLIVEQLAIKAGW